MDQIWWSGTHGALAANLRLWNPQLLSESPGADDREWIHFRCMHLISFDNLKKQKALLGGIDLWTKWLPNLFIARTRKRPSGEVDFHIWQDSDRTMFNESFNRLSFLSPSTSSHYCSLTLNICKNVEWMCVYILFQWAVPFQIHVTYLKPQFLSRRGESNDLL